MLEAIGAVLLWGVLPCAVMIWAGRRLQASSARTLCTLLALQLALSVLLALALPELAAMALFPEPSTPGDTLDFGAGLFVAGATMLMSGGLLAAWGFNVASGVLRLRQRGGA